MPLDRTTGQIAMDCVGCSSGAVTERPDLTAQGYRRFRCRDCDQQFNERSDGVLNRASLPSDIIAFVVFCRLRYRLTLRDLSEIMLLRGFTVSHESIRRWEAKLLPVMGEALRKRRHGIGRSSGQSCTLTKPTSRSMAAGAACIGRSIPIRPWQPADAVTFSSTPASRWASCRSHSQRI